MVKSQLVNRKQISSTLVNEMWDALEDMHKKTGLDKSKLLDEAVFLLNEQFSIMGRVELIAMSKFEKK